MFLGIRHHYQRVERELTTSIPLPQQNFRHHLIVPLASLNSASRYSLAYARSISPHVTAVHVAIDPHEVKMVRSEWERLQKHLDPEGEMQLVVIESPYRSLTRPLLAYIAYAARHHRHGHSTASEQPTGEEAL
jgi:hypothetical protein